jgi:hypothetical protein
MLLKLLIEKCVGGIYCASARANRVDFQACSFNPLGHLSFECARRHDFEHHTNSWIERWTKDDEIAGTCRSS